MIFRLYPEELPSSNRITEQLMYLDRRKEENESSSEKRKTILMWNGLVSWGGVETGQKEFLKQNCPINRNTYDLKRIELFLLFTFTCGKITSCCLCLLLTTQTRTGDLKSADTKQQIYKTDKTFFIWKTFES